MSDRLHLANAAPAPPCDVVPHTPQPRRRHVVSSVAPDAASSRTTVDVDRINLDLVSCSRDVWGQPTLRPAQLQVAAALVDPQKPNNLIASLQTGYGKSHIVQTLGAYLAGFTLIFIPLLSLSADALEKFQSANQKFGRVRVYHLDELLPDHCLAYKEFLNLC